MTKYNKVIGNWYSIPTYTESHELKMSLKDIYPKETDTDLTFKEFLEPCEIEFVLVHRGEISAWVSLKLADDSMKKVQNLSMVIFDKNPVISSLCLLMQYISGIYDEVNLFTKAHSTTDKIIQKVNNKLGGNLVKPILENITVYQFKKAN